MDRKSSKGRVKRLQKKHNQPSIEPLSSTLGLENKEAFEIIKGSLNYAIVQRKLNFPVTYLINEALLNAQKENASQYIDTLKQKNPTIYKIFARK